MKLHDLHNSFNRQSRSRVGRGDGSGHGRTCGRGDKGAGARSGATRRPHFEGGQIPLFRRLPKRGFNSPNHKMYSVVNIRYLEENFSAGDQVDVETLKSSGLGEKGNAGLKVLGDGEVTKSLTVRAQKFSASARQKIEAAGGSCEIV